MGIALGKQSLMLAEYLSLCLSFSVSVSLLLRLAEYRSLCNDMHKAVVRSHQVIRSIRYHEDGHTLADTYADVC
jgi:hypothetical protein